MSTLTVEPAESEIPPVIGLAHLAKQGFDGVDLGPLWQQLAEQFAQDNDNVALLMDMCVIDQIRNNAPRGLAFQKYALDNCRLYQLPAKSAPAKLRLLGFACAGNISANMPIEFLIADSDVTLLLMYVAPGMPLPPVPEHDLAIVLAAESAENLPLLRELEQALADWPRPILNPPALIPQVGREQLFKVLKPIAGIEIPATTGVDRAALESAARQEIPIEALVLDGGFPVIVRPRDSHGGRGLEKIDTAPELLSYLARQPEADFYVSRFIDYRSPDGLYRKYRIAIVDGRPFPCHLGISEHWMIHFVNAGMLENADKRAEEARFMDRFGEEFGRRHRLAMAEMAEATGLDYFGIDCAETQDGRLLIFEADTSLVVHNMDNSEIFPYKARHMRSIFDAFRELMREVTGFSPAQAGTKPGRCTGIIV